VRVVVNQILHFEAQLLDLFVDFFVGFVHASTLLVAGHERQERDVPGALDSHAQTALFVLFETRLFAGLDLSELIDVALQGLEVLVVKICHVCPMLKNLRHNLIPFSISWF
jgi:hypothetical protein